MTEEKPTYLGHRARLKQKVFDKGIQSLTDCELLELVLMLAIPRRDVKPIAKKLLAEFQSLSGVIHASPEQLKMISGIKESTALVFQTVQGVCERMAKIEINQAPVLEKWDKILDYCYVTLAQRKNECFYVLYLDTKRRLISTEEHQKGTVNHTPIYPREILKRALILEASAVILVHNHPSGNPNPSPEDIAHTQDLAKILKTSDISIHDHLIIGKNGIVSFRQFGLI